MRKPRLLIVDDDRMLNHNITWLLKRKGYEVLGVEDGQSAVRVVDEQEFDIVILDQKMPGMDGIETLKEIKKETS